MDQEFKVRTAKSHDATDAVRVIRNSIEQLCYLDHNDDDEEIRSWQKNKTTENFLQWLANDNLTELVAETSQKVVGVTLASKTNAEIMLLYVDPEFQYRGISSALLGAIEDVLLSAGHHSLKLVSTVTSRQFYINRGWSSIVPEGLDLQKIK